MTSAEFTHQVAAMRRTLQLFTRKFTSDREESHDLVQETILKALTHREKFREDTNLKGWLFTIMRNTFINNYRKSQRTRTIRHLWNNPYFSDTEDEHTFNRPQENLEFNEIWKNINNLKHEFLTPFKMHSTGYKYQEIAEHLGIPIGTVKNRIFHARKEIQKNLQGY
jgi:RNA polymerase sigma factor (sigma-70 family)